MFHMMNEARIGIGLAATALGLAGYYASLEYAKNRPQGRPVGPAGKDPAQPQIRIIEHADIKRMLLAQKSYCEGALALLLYCARLVDEQHTGTPEAAEEARLLLEVLTPVAKSWPSEFCLEANSLAIQIHGGYGYTRDFPVEQYWRDNRLNMIHEGTHGIQAADLLGRKVVMEGGKGLILLAARINATIEQAIQRPELAEHANALGAGAAEGGRRDEVGVGDRQPADALANAVPYMQAFGHLVIAWTWLDVLLALPAVTAAPAHEGRGAPPATSSTTNCRRSAPGCASSKPATPPAPPCRRTPSDGYARTLARLDALAWTLIYGGLFAVVLGIASHDTAKVAGWSLSVLGALAATAGVVLIVVRSRLRETGRQSRIEILTNITETPQMTRTVQQLFDLQGKTALVTGGSRGLGLQMAHALGEAGARIMLSFAQGGRPGGGRGRPAGGRHRRALDRRRLRARGGHPQAGRPDHGAHGRHRHPGEQRRRRLGRAAEDHPVEAWDKVMNLNVRGYFILSQQVAKRSMIPRKSGRIINIASIAGLGGNPAGDEHAGLQHLQGRGHHLHPGAGLRVGQVRHQRQRHLPGLLPQPDDQGHAGAHGRGQAGRNAPLRRLGDDEDLKGITLLYASDAGKHITGQWLAVDGGCQRRDGRAEAVATPKLFGVEIPFVSHLGFELVPMERGLRS